MNARKKSEIDDLFRPSPIPPAAARSNCSAKRPRRAGELADLLDLPAPAMSRHLKSLKAVRPRRRIPSRVRCPRPRLCAQRPRLSELKDWLARAEQGWTGPALRPSPSMSQSGRPNDLPRRRLHPRALLARAGLRDLHSRRSATGGPTASSSASRRAAPASSPSSRPRTGSAGRLVEQLPNGKTFEIGPCASGSPASASSSAGARRTSGPEHATEVEVRFEPVGAETRVTVEHRGWDSVPQEHLARHGFPLSSPTSARANNGAPAWSSS